MRGVRQVATGSQHTLILTSEGTLLACGANNVGQLGMQGEDQYKPTVVPFDREIHSIHCGNDFSMVLAVADHTVWTTGSGEDGRLGLSDSRNRGQFTIIPGLAAKQVACGDGHTMAIDLQSRLWAWGGSFDGQLSITQTSTPTIVLKDVAAMSLGYYHTIVRTIDNKWSERKIRTCYRRSIVFVSVEWR